MRNETIKILINYDIFKLAANGQKRTISNYLEYATLNYTMNEMIVDDIERMRYSSMRKILKKLYLIFQLKGIE